MHEFESGKWLKQNRYQSFSPSLIDRPWKMDEPLILEALSRADRHIGRLR